MSSEHENNSNGDRLAYSISETISQAGVGNIGATFAADKHTGTNESA